MTTVMMKKLCTKCEGLYLENTVECPWCRHDKLVPMSEEQYNKLYIDIDVENYREEPKEVVKVQAKPTLTEIVFTPSDEDETEQCEQCLRFYDMGLSYADQDYRFCSIKCEDEFWEDWD